MGYRRINKFGITRYYGGRKTFQKYGTSKRKLVANYRRRRKPKSPYQVSVIGSDGMGVDYVVKNRRTGWTKMFSKFSANGRPVF